MLILNLMLPTHFKQAGREATEDCERSVWIISQVNRFTGQRPWYRDWV